MNSFEFKRCNSEESSTKLFELWTELIEENNIAEIKSRIKSGKLNPFNEVLNGLTPLHMACIQGSSAIVKFLMSLGVDANYKSKLGRTPIQEALYYGHVDCLNALLERGVRLCPESQAKPRKTLRKPFAMEIHQNN